MVSLGTRTCTSYSILVSCGCIASATAYRELLTATWTVGKFILRVHWCVKWYNTHQVIEFSQFNRPLIFNVLSYNEGLPHAV